MLLRMLVPLRRHCWFLNCSRLHANAYRP
jgi:hypothetical protein